MSSEELPLVEFRHAGASVKVQLYRGIPAEEVTSLLDAFFPGSAGKITGLRTQDGRIVSLARFCRAPDAASVELVLQGAVSAPLAAPPASHDDARPLVVEIRHHGCRKLVGWALQGCPPHEMRRLLESLFGVPDSLRIVGLQRWSHDRRGAAKVSNLALEAVCANPSLLEPYAVDERRAAAGGGARGAQPLTYLTLHLEPAMMGPSADRVAPAQMDHKHTEAKEDRKVVESEDSEDSRSIPFSALRILLLEADEAAALRDMIKKELPEVQAAYRTYPGLEALVRGFLRFSRFFLALQELGYRLLPPRQSEQAAAEESKERSGTEAAQADQAESAQQPPRAQLKERQERRRQEREWERSQRRARSQTAAAATSTTTGDATTAGPAASERRERVDEAEDKDEADDSDWRALVAPEDENELGAGDADEVAAGEGTEDERRRYHQQYQQYKAKLLSLKMEVMEKLHENELISAQQLWALLKLLQIDHPVLNAAHRLYQANDDLAVYVSNLRRIADVVIAEALKDSPPAGDGQGRGADKDVTAAQLTSQRRQDPRAAASAGESGSGVVLGKKGLAVLSSSDETRRADRSLMARPASDEEGEEDEDEAFSYVPLPGGDEDEDESKAERAANIPEAWVQQQLQQLSLSTQGPSRQLFGKKAPSSRDAQSRKRATRRSTKTRSQAKQEGQGPSALGRSGKTVLGPEGRSQPASGQKDAASRSAAAESEDVSSTHQRSGKRGLQSEVSSADDRAFAEFSRFSRHVALFEALHKTRLLTDDEFSALVFLREKEQPLLMTALQQYEEDNDMEEFVDSALRILSLWAQERRESVVSAAEEELAEGNIPATEPLGDVAPASAAAAASEPTARASVANAASIASSSAEAVPSKGNEQQLRERVERAAEERLKDSIVPEGHVLFGPPSKRRHVDERVHDALRSIQGLSAEDTEAMRELVGQLFDAAPSLVASVVQLARSKDVLFNAAFATFKDDRDVHDFIDTIQRLLRHDSPGTQQQLQKPPQQEQSEKKEDRVAEQQEQEKRDRAAAPAASAAASSGADDENRGKNQQEAERSDEDGDENEDEEDTVDEDADEDTDEDDEKEDEIPIIVVGVHPKPNGRQQPQSQERSGGPRPEIAVDSKELLELICNDLTEEEASTLRRLWVEDPAIEAAIAQFRRDGIATTFVSAVMNRLIEARVDAGGEDRGGDEASAEAKRNVHIELDALEQLHQAGILGDETTEVLKRRLQARDETALQAFDAFRVDADFEKLREKLLQTAADH